ESYDPYDNHPHNPPPLQITKDRPSSVRKRERLHLGLRQTHHQILHYIELDDHAQLADSDADSCRKMGLPIMLFST
ncbi:hypothetical protein, partial [Alicyclobacillus suci]|uniref:hypothetical protein n=1 Tax=Alicyclobacillus suci TaxID=2816080 RepID=UPI001F1E3063